MEKTLQELQLTFQNFAVNSTYWADRCTRDDLKEYYNAKASAYLHCAEVIERRLKIEKENEESQRQKDLQEDCNKDEED